ncbi:hypothetical protein [Desulfosporosinus sp. FKA]|uniref:hypothetical protein n=1 Tax=Desulfosporosinus sp. FKA TaxID=1969834 RepID=UPI000B49AA09|nr:hypothetical protein [Desulfosporosinus sp. FKA]
MFTKSDKYYILNSALIVITIVCVFTGINFNNRLRFAHEIAGYLMTIIIAVHLALHTQWIKTVTLSIIADKKKLMALMLTLLITIGVCSYSLFHSSANQRGGGHFGRQHRNCQNFNPQNLP